MAIELGIDGRQFRNEFSGRKPLLARGAVTGRKFLLEDLEQILYCTEPRTPDFSIHDGQGFVAEKEYTEPFVEMGVARNRLAKIRFYELLRRGATLILNRVEARSTVIKQICCDIGRYASQPVLANGYLCRRDLPSFGLHWDTHDVFAVQLLGRKRWQLYPPTFELPVAGQASRHSSSEALRECEPFLDVTLEERDVLYVPRGWWHCVTGVGTTTFHLSIGVHSPHVRDYIAWLCANVLPARIEFRRTLPMHRSEGEPDADAAFDLIRQAAVALGDVMSSREYFEQYCQRVLDSERLHLPLGLAEEFLESADIGTGATITLSSIYLRDLSKFTHLNGERLPVAGLDADALRALSERGDLSISQLARELNVSIESVNAIVKDLAARGLVFLRS